MLRNKEFALNFAETHRMLKEAFDEQALSQAKTFEWFYLLAPEFYIQILAHPVCKM
jgi:hypothetical protein